MSDETKVVEGEATADAAAAAAADKGDANVTDNKVDSGSAPAGGDAGKGGTSAAAAATGEKGGGAAAAGDGAGDGDKPGAWPDDWVTRMAKGDQKRAKDLGRYTSPEAVADAYVKLRARLDSGEFIPALPKNATEKEVAQWRKSVGLPEKADGYDLSGLKIESDDKDVIGSFLGRLHKVNAPNAVTREVVSMFYDELARQNTETAERDEKHRQETLDDLNEEWGPNYRRNLNMVEGTIMSRFPERIREALRSARMPDGRALFNSPDVVRTFVELANEINPLGITPPGGVGDIGKTMIEEYKGIQKYRQENRAKYNKDDNTQKRETELIAQLVKQGLMTESGELIERKAA